MTMFSWHATKAPHTLPCSSGGTYLITPNSPRQHNALLNSIPVAGTPSGPYSIQEEITPVLLRVLTLLQRLLEPGGSEEAEDVVTTGRSSVLASLAGIPAGMWQFVTPQLFALLSHTQVRQLHLEPAACWHVMSMAVFGQTGSLAHLRNVVFCVQVSVVEDVGLCAFILLEV